MILPKSPKKLDVDLEQWLGSSGPEDFESIDEILDYFSDENLTRMFSGDWDPDNEEDREERDLACRVCCEIWEEENQE